MTNQQSIRLAYIWAAVLISVLLLFASCMTPEKAVQYLKHKKLLDDACAANYPCVTTDSVRTIVESNDSAFQDVIGHLQGDLFDALRQADSLNTVINATENVADTNCIKYTAAIRSLRIKIDNIRDSIRRIPPVVQKIETKVKVRDTALDQVCQDHLAEANKTVNNLKTDLAWMTDSKNWWKKAALITWAIILILFLLGYLAHRIQSKKLLG